MLRYTQVLVCVERFEPSTSSVRGKRATILRHTQVFYLADRGGIEPYQVHVSMGRTVFKTVTVASRRFVYPKFLFHHRQSAEGRLKQYFI